MKNLIPLILSIVTISTMAQNNKCATDLIIENAIIENPVIKENLDNFYSEFEEYKTKKQRQSTDSIRIIPTVFHIIHQGGNENISKAQILTQLRVLNEDMRRENADTINTPSVFSPFGADTKVEFKLAKIDPWGNCTDGINRVYSHTTNGASGSNGVNTAAYWNSNNYLNIWVVNSMENSGVAGYAYLPNTAPTPYLDGIVILSSYIGDWRTLTHEAGHYLGLKHTWGGAAGESFCGDDNVDDTPIAYDANFGCPPFPELNNCEFGDSINGEMFSNYMDYTSDNCQNIFTKGQKDLIDFTLHGNTGTDGFRSNLWSEDNLITTGLSENIILADCLPVAEFSENHRMICVGESITFTDASWRGTINNRSWVFEGGTPATSTDSVEYVFYNTAGIFDVTFEVSNNAGTATITKNERIIVSNDWGNLNQNSYQEDFENPSSYYQKWHVFNQDNNNSWSHYTNGGHYSNNCLKINNFENSPNEIDELISPSYNLHNFSNAQLNFKYAGSSRNMDPSDRLQIYVSNDCGKNWNLRGSVQYAALANNGFQSNEFEPNSSTIWSTKSISIVSTYLSDNVRFKFKFTADGESGNNIYIDDINITGSVSVNEPEILDFHISPNPFTNDCSVHFLIKEDKFIELEVLNLLGKQVQYIFSDNFTEGSHKIAINRKGLNKGIYLLKASTKNGQIIKKMIIN